MMMMIMRGQNAAWIEVLVALMMALIAVLSSVIVMVETGRVRIPGVQVPKTEISRSGDRMLDRLVNELAYQERENEAVARLYENVLDVIQCRPGGLQQQMNLRRQGGQQEEPVLRRQPVQDQNWKSPEGLGQISGVSVDPTTGRPLVFHRGDHVWDYNSFDENNQYTKARDGPISVDTVLALNPDSGAVEDQWGSDIFYLPHGIHVDPRGNVWLTDVALHQVFKFTKRRDRETAGGGEYEPEPSLILGERFVPGSDSRHFCQPTAVAVMPPSGSDDSGGGQVVVADGYCNDRLLVFDQHGRTVAQFPPYDQRDTLRLRVPHSLTIVKRRDICVADREHQRIVCFDLVRALALLENENYHNSKIKINKNKRKMQKKNSAIFGPGASSSDDSRQLFELMEKEQRQQQQQQQQQQNSSPSWLSLIIHRPGLCRIFGITSHEDMLYGVNGPTTPNNPVMGFTLNPEDGSVVSTWGPTFESFANPHDIAACPNNSALYVSEIGPNVVWKFKLLTDWKM